MKLTHIGISQFRSIGSEPVMIDLTKRITVIVGQNDCGKSNVLRGIQMLSQNKDSFIDPREPWGSRVHKMTLRTDNSFVAPSRPELIAEFDLFDYHKRDQTVVPRVWITVSDPNGDTHLDSPGRSLTFASNVTTNLDSVDALQLKRMEPSQLKSLLPPPARFGNTKFEAPFDPSNVLLKNHVARVLAFHGLTQLPRAYMVPQLRHIHTKNESSANTFDGNGVVELLASWQVPDVGHELLKAKLDRVVALLRDLIGRPNATLEVPGSQKEIVVTDGEMRLPLESHGTGVHQLIILAIAVLSEDGVIFGIEEPEIHLHPVLQRRFLDFLLTKTSNRYIITTHSACLIAPSETVDVIHLKMIDGVTTPTKVDTDVNALAVLDDLGVRASDLLQANSVIWVEGPSDRIYLNRWIQLMDPTLREGIDYAIMFYGGKLMSHLTLEREKEGFIKLLRINQRSSIVMDRDRDNSSAAINNTKQRIQEECSRNGLHAWVTEGREIENYLPDEAVNSALAENGVSNPIFAMHPFQHLEDLIKAACGDTWKDEWDYKKDKPNWAHKFSSHIQRASISGTLEAHLNALIAFIKPSIA